MNNFIHTNEKILKKARIRKWLHYIRVSLLLWLTFSQRFLFTEKTTTKNQNYLKKKQWPKPNQNQNDIKNRLKTNDAPCVQVFFSL